MKEKIYELLSSMAETFYKQANSENTVYPLIVYYYVLNEPLYQADNSYSNERRIILNVEVYDDGFVDELAQTVENRLKNELKAVLQNETELDEDNGVFGVRYEFEIHDLK